MLENPADGAFSETTKGIFVPLEVLEIVGETLERRMTLSRHWDWEGFPPMAWSLCQALNASILTQASDEQMRVWDLEIEGHSHHLTWDSLSGAVLEPRTPAARSALDRNRTRLLTWATDMGPEPEVLRGKHLSNVPDRAYLEPEAPGLRPRKTRKRFIWMRGVLGLGCGAGTAWLVAHRFSDNPLPWPTSLLLAFGVFPVIGYAWASWMWRQGRS